MPWNNQSGGGGWKSGGGNGGGPWGQGPSGGGQPPDLEEMLKRGLSLGGEQSGHIIFSHHLFTGDGIATALNVLRVMADTGRDLAELANQLVTYPQVLLNVRVREKRDYQAVPAIAAAMARVEEQLAGNGRLLVRYSGTEPLLRVMIEGRDQHEIQTWAAEIANSVKEHLG